MDCFPCFGVPTYARRCPITVPPLQVTVSLGPARGLDDTPGGRVRGRPQHAGGRLPLRDHLDETGPALGRLADARCLHHPSGAAYRSDPPPFLTWRGLDGYLTCLPLADVLSENVLLADSLDGKPLTLKSMGPRCGWWYPTSMVTRASSTFVVSSSPIGIDRASQSVSPGRIPRDKVASRNKAAGCPGGSIAGCIDCLCRP